MRLDIRASSLTSAHSSKERDRLTAARAPSLDWVPAGPLRVLPWGCLSSEEVGLDDLRTPLQFHEAVVYLHHDSKPRETFVQTLLELGSPYSFQQAGKVSSNDSPGYVYAVASLDTVYTEGPCHIQTSVWNQSTSRSCPRRILTASRKLDH